MPLVWLRGELARRGDLLLGGAYLTRAGKLTVRPLGPCEALRHHVAHDILGLTTCNNTHTNALTSHWGQFPLSLSRRCLEIVIPKEDVKAPGLWIDGNGTVEGRETKEKFI